MKDADKAIRIFNEACELLAKIPKPFHIYLASGSMHLMRGPSHDDNGRPQQHNILASALQNIRIDGGDW